MKLNKLNFSLAVSVPLLLVVGTSFCVLPRAAKAPASNVANRNAAHVQTVDRYGQLPLAFEINRGQSDSQVRFLARGQGYGLFLTSQEAVLSLRRSEASSARKGKLDDRSSELVPARLGLFSDPSLPAPGFSGPRSGERMTDVSNAVLHMRMVGANASARVTGEEELPGKSNYFIGNDPKKWRTNIPTYAKVRLENVYPGVDLVYYGNQGQLEYDFVVNPGADPREIKLALAASLSKEKGQRSEKSDVKIAEDGDLAVQVDGGEARFHKPVIYQLASLSDSQKTTDRIPVDGRYTMNDQNEVAFAVAEYDRTKPLVIDPVLAYSTYLGGSGNDFGNGIAVDSSGNAYVAGQTTSTDFPLVQPMQTTNKGGNAFISKLNTDGSALVYSTYLGGTYTSAYLSCCGANAIAVDSSGNAIVTGATSAVDFPTVNAFQGSYQGFCGIFGCGTNAFVTKVDASGSALIYSTYLGGFGADQGNGIAVDSSGSAYVTGRAGSSNFPTTANAYQTTNRARNGDFPSDAFVSKFSTDGSLVYSTYLGGAGNANGGDWGNGIAVDSSGSAYVTGVAGSLDFPTVNPIQAYEPEGGGGNKNTFLSKVSPDGSALVYSTCLGGPHDDWGRGIALDSSGDAYVVATSFVAEVNAAGSALVYSNPNLNGAAITLDGSGNAYIVATAGQSVLEQVNPDGSLGYTFTLDSSGQGGADAIAADSFANVYVTGATQSTAFMTTSNAFQSANHGGYDAFVAKISPGAVDLDITNSAASVVVSGSTLTYTIALTNNGPDAASNVNIQDTIPAGATFNSVAVSAGTCTAPAAGETGTVTCTMPSMASGTSFTETLVVNVAAGLGTMSDTATVSSSTFDTTPGDHSSTVSTTVVGLPSVGAIGGQDPDWLSAPLWMRVR